jgi:hypothetical protein
MQTGPFHLKIADFRFSTLVVCCIFPPSAILQGNVKMFGRNVDKAKVEVKVGVEDFFAKAFEKNYITIWSCMKLDDVLEVFPMFMPKFCELVCFHLWT